MNAGNDDFFIAAFDQCFGFGDGRFNRFIARRFAQLRHNAIGTTRIATILNLQESAGLFAEAFHRELVRVFRQMKIRIGKRKGLELVSQHLNPSRAGGNPRVDTQAIDDFFCRSAASEKHRRAGVFANQRT